MIENKDMCKKCGGRCCKKSGCDYLPQDFNDLTTNGLYEKLKEGNISIIASLKVETLPNNNIYINPFLYLRARNINRDIVDLLSLKTTCTQLTETGCRYSYDERPSIGKNLIPMDDFKCYPKENPIALIESWESYQKVLSKLVKRFTNLSVEEKLSEDVENLFLDVLFEKYKGVDEIEINDVKDMMLTLIQCYPLELENATKKYENKTYIKAYNK